MKQIRPLKSLWRILMPAIIVGTLITLTTLVLMTLLSSVVSNVFLDHQQLRQVMTLLVWLLGCIVVRAILVWVREILVQRAALFVKSRLRRQLAAHVFARGPLYCEGERTGELVATLYEGVERLDAYVSRYLPQRVMSVVTPLLIATYLFSLDWMSATLLLISCPIIPLLMILVGSYTKKHIERQWSDLTYMSAHFLDAIQGLTTLKLFGRSAAERRRVARISERFREKTLKVLRMASLSGMILELMTAFAIALVAVMLGVRVIDGNISFQSAFLVLLLTPEFYRPLRELGVHYHAGVEGKAAMKSITAIMEISQAQLVPQVLDASEVRDVQTTMDAPSPLPFSQPPTLELTTVTYSYEDSSQLALDNVTLTLPANTCTAVVGRSGAGKSTLVNVLMRFIEPQDGAVMVNGIPLKDIPVDIWREHVALVPQHPHLFYGSVLDNIRMARPTASLQEVEQAATYAGASECIEQLPQGYDTHIGERGTRLSAGQAQRIALARAFLKDAPFLILDEPTSSLDPQSERFIRRAIEQLVANRSVLVIAHRLNTIMRADQIIVLDKGHIIERGQHAELVRRNSVYARMVQASRTREIAV